MQNALMKIYIDTRTTAPRNTSPPTPQDRVASATTARSATHSSPFSPRSAACATTSSPMMMPLAEYFSPHRDQVAVDYCRFGRGVCTSAHRSSSASPRASSLPRSRSLYLGAQHVGRIQDVCTRGRQIPLQSISKLRAARNVCLVHLSQHQAAVGAACKATSTRMQGKERIQHKEFRLAQICAPHRQPRRARPRRQGPEEGGGIFSFA